MTQYNNDNSAVLFKNDRKEKESHPDYNGNAEVGGVEYWLNAWVKESKTGKKFFSLSFTPKEKKRGEAPDANAPLDSMESEIPF